MVLLAFSLQDQIDKYGTYIGIAAFFGLAVLTLLYFAQAREVKRLREWAGTAPERITELEELIEDLRAAPPAAVPAAAPQTLAPSRPQVQPQPVVATNGAHKLEPAEVAALAFARAAGVREPHEPRHHAQPVASTATAPATEVAAGAAAVATGEPAGAQAVNGGSAGHPPVPRPATPAARRSEQPLPPLPPRRAAAAANRRPAASPPPQRERSGMRAVIVTAVIGVLVLAGAVYGITRLTGADEEPTANQPNEVASPTPDAGGDEPAATATPEPRVTKENVKVGVYNSTGQTGLAGIQRDLLLADGYPEANLGTGDANEQRPTSVILYERGARGVAQDVAEVLGIADIKQLADDPTAESLVRESGTKWNVVAIIGADKSS